MNKNIETAIKMLESLPEEVQKSILERLREFVEEARDEARWDELFEQRKEGLITAAKNARKEIAEGKATEMDIDKL